MSSLRLLPVLVVSLLFSATARAEEPPPWSLGHDGNPLAGYHRGVFYLRDASDSFRLYPSAMLLVDGQAWMGKNTATTQFAPRTVVRAARVGLGGQVLGSIGWQLTLAADGQPLGGDKQIYAAPPGQTPTASSARYESPQAPGNATGILDAWVDLKAADELHVMVGQFREPFGMETSTALGSLPFHERSIATRTVASPNVRDVGAMLWGDVPQALLGYQLGFVSGDGRNRPGVDRRGDALARVTLTPLGEKSGLVVGASVRGGWRQSDAVRYDVPSVRTQQGFALWQPVYADSLGRRVHVIPADAQRAVGLEASLLLGVLDLRGEVTLMDDDTREAVEGFQSQNTERTGTLSGVGGYLVAGVTLWGKPRLRGQPGTGVRPRSLDFAHYDPVVPAQQIEALVRVEGLGLRYDSAKRKGAADPEGIDGDIRVLGLGLGVNYWATRHARLSLNYDLYRTPTETTDRAQVPGGTTLHELGARAGIMF